MVNEEHNSNNNNNTLIYKYSETKESERVRETEQKKGENARI